MICPNCFAENKNSARVCHECGAPLTGDTAMHMPAKSRGKNQTVTPPTSEDAYARLRARAENAVTEDTTNKSADAKDFDDAFFTPEESAAGEGGSEADFYNSEMEVSKQSSEQTTQQSGAVYRADKKTRERADWGEENDLESTRIIKGGLPPMPARTATLPPYARVAKSKKRKRNHTALTLAVWIICLAGVMAAGFYGWRWLDAHLFNPVEHTAAPTGQTANIEPPTLSVRQKEDGTEYISAIFFGTPGDSVYIAPLNRYIPFTGNELTLELQLSDLLPAGTLLDNPSVSVNLAPIYRTAGGVQIPMNVAPVTLRIQQTQVNLVSPKLFSSEIYQPSYEVVFTVTPGSTVLINDVNCTDKADAGGKVTYLVACKPGEQKELRIVARAPYRQSASLTVTLFRSALPVTFSLSTSNPTKVYENKVVISGNVDKDAVLSVEGYTILDAYINQQYGIFTLTVELPYYGQQDMIISATTTAGTSRLAYSVFYQPDELEYTKKAWPYDPNLLVNPAGFMHKIFVFEGPVITAVETNAEGQLLTLNMGTAESPKILYVLYSGTRKLEAGGSYRLFADVTGTQNGAPLLIARFVYTKSG